jgi:hypothetical protein
LAGCTGSLTDPNGLAAPDTGPVRIDDGLGNPVEVTLAPRAMMRLTAEQYANAIEDVFVAELRPTAEELPPDADGYDFRAFGATSVSTSPGGVERYHNTALRIAAAALERRDDFDALRGCAPADASDPCVEAVLETLGRRLWRRPLTTEELDRLTGIVRTAATHPDAVEVGVPVATELGLEHAIAVLLASPSFLYVAQEGEIDPVTGQRRYTSLEMASRLAFFVWGSTPDEELIAAGAAGELTEVAAIEAQVERMLGAPRGQDLLVRFLAEAWGVENLESIEKNETVFPEWSPSVARAAYGEFREVLLDIVAEDRSVLTLFDTPTGFANAELGALYGVEVEGDALTPFAYPDGRAGLLTSVAVMAANAKPSRTSPTARGVFVRWKVLCEPVPPPPEDVAELMAEEMSSADPASTRDALERHQTEPVCAGCHALFDPLGLPFETYDGIGRFRVEDQGSPVDPTSTFEGTDLADASDLVAFVASDPRATSCFVQQLYGVAQGHRPGSGERELVDRMTKSFAESDHLFQEAVTRIATSPGFRFFAEESP